MRTIIEENAHPFDKVIVVKVEVYVHVNVNKWNDEYGDSETARTIRSEVKSRATDVVADHFRWMDAVHVEPSLY